MNTPFRNRILQGTVLATILGGSGTHLLLAQQSSTSTARRTPATPPRAVPSPLAELRRSFVAPPRTARPWVYWTWLSGNVSKEGITADLEAMNRVGIGGALILEVDQGTPHGPMQFMDATWQSMFKHAVSEAKRLGMEINMNNGAGYYGSGGSWVPPEKAMQSVMQSETHVTGGATWTGTLPKPTRAAEYRDIAVYAVKEPNVPGNARYKIADFEMKALQWRSWVAYRGTQSAPLNATAPADAIIPLDGVVDLTSKMDASGKLTWDVPAGEWTILRIGHAWNGSVIGPVSRGEGGPETDKLSKEATQLHFNAFVKKLNELVGPEGSKTLVATHIDSWEGGGQTWTPAMREEFRKRRGYDILPWLPVLSGRVIGNLQMTERFLWDLRKTVSELMVENYAAEMQRLAHQNGLRLSFESYTTAGNDLDAANFADEPTAEFWTPNGQGLDFQPTLKSMSSAAHINGHAVVGAESFTSGGSEKWRWHPGLIKGIGDEAFSQGVNRFIFHRYAAQRFVAPKPGLQMGPWGLHYERTNTWWEWSRPWHTYLARSQYLLRQGEFVADVLRLQPDEPLLRFQLSPLTGYDYDVCGPDTFSSLTVRDGKITLPSGRQYAMLALAPSNTMTVPMLTHLRDLVRQGAVIVGTPPQATPGLTDYPRADAQLKTLVAQVWGEAAPTQERTVGKGKVFSGITPEAALARSSVAPDFISDGGLRWIHRRLGTSDIYFVANTGADRVAANCEFRVTGKQPELWNPETGSIEQVAAFTVKGVTMMPLEFEPQQSVFLVFTPNATKVDAVTSIARNGKPLVVVPKPPLKVTVEKATYGVPGDTVRTRDVREKVQRYLDNQEWNFPVGRLAEGDDPAWGIVKTLVVDYAIDGQHFTSTGTDTDNFEFKRSLRQAQPTGLFYNDKHQLVIEARQTGNYQFQTAAGRKIQLQVPPIPAAQPVTGSWKLSFPTSSGVGAPLLLDSLISWSELPDPNAKYYSGAATYVKTLSIPASRLTTGTKLTLDLGDVQAMARVKVNGKSLGTLWKAPYRVDITSALKAGDNALEIEVVNLWPNRLIGDEQLPEDSDRNGNGTLKSWPQWLLDGKPSPTGRQSFSSWRLYKMDDKLQPSGLLGPVTLETAMTFVR